MIEVDISDRASDFATESTREYTKNGFLKVKGRVARSGIQTYYRCELNQTKDPFKLAKIYRPPEVVLSDEVCKMFDGADVTNGHPKKFISPESYRNLTSGVILGKAYRDEEKPDFLVCDMLIKDENTIKSIEAGKIALSVGYRNQLDWTPGVTPDGQEYDARVEKITLVNHVALVDRARAGYDAHIFDGYGGKMKTVKIGAQEFEVNDSVADAIESELKNLESRTKEAEEAVAMKDGELGKMSAQIEDLKQKLEEAESNVMTDEDLKAVLSAADAVRQSAKKIAGDDFVCDSFDPLEIMKSAIAASGCGVDMNDKDEKFVEGFFNAAVLAKESDMNDSQKCISDSMKNGSKKTERKSAYDALKEKEANAWKN